MRIFGIPVYAYGRGQRPIAAGWVTSTQHATRKRKIATTRRRLETITYRIPNADRCYNSLSIELSVHENIQMESRPIFDKETERWSAPKSRRVSRALVNESKSSRRNGIYLSRRLYGIGNEIFIVFVARFMRDVMIFVAVSNNAWRILLCLGVFLYLCFLSILCIFINAVFFWETLQENWCKISWKYYLVWL